ncbi:MAG: aldehyde ferredoxin oxidoreductase family protein [Nitrososphaeria archaeon]|jgi:aldehyde:ferredoxin oxidoreductase
MWYGYTGKIARINLSTKNFKVEDLDKELAEKYIGSIGIAGKVLFDEVPPWASAYDPVNLLIFATGPVTGTNTQTAGRHSVVTKSPLTGCFGDSSVGGYFGVEQKRAGYDMLIFVGRSTEPVLVSVVDGDVRFIDASPYWGMDTRECERAIRKDMGDRRVQVSCIGPAGENLVRYACIMHDDAGRAAGRCGVGAVMGYKNLKAVAVRGSREISVANPNALNEVMREVLENYRTSPGVKRFHEAGTMGGYEANMGIGDSPTYNYANEQFGEFDEERTKKLAYPGGYEKILAKTNTCYMCAIACRRVSKKGEGKYILEEGEVEGVEYESLSMLGSNLGIDDIFAVNLMNDMCNKLGLDTISTGGTIGFAMECYERGILSKEDTEGIELKFGNADAGIALIQKISKREGIGNLLAEGSRRAGLIIGKGAGRYSIHAKGMEFPAHDPRTFQGGGPHYACCPVGADHMEGISLFVEGFGQRFPEIGIEGDYGTRYVTEKKAFIAKMIEDWYAFLASAGWCLMCSSRYGALNRFVRAFNAVTGQNLTIEDGRLAGERIYNLKREFNIKHGVTIEEDTLPERLLKEPNKKSDNAVVKLNETLPEYLKLRGWSLSNK